MAIFSRNPMYSVLYIIVTLLSIAGHFLLLNAQFLAIVQFIVYTGAVMVLFLTVVMLLNLNEAIEPQKSTLVRMSGILVAGFFLILLIANISGADKMVTNVTTGSNIGMVKNLGKTLFKDYLLPFEVASVLFLSAMVGAVLLARKDTPKI